jgi:hypothetical protein
VPSCLGAVTVILAILVGVCGVLIKVGLLKSRSLAAGNAAAPGVIHFMVAKPFGGVATCMSPESNMPATSPDPRKESQAKSKTSVSKLPKLSKTLLLDADLQLLAFLAVMTGEWSSHLSMLVTHQMGIYLPLG